MILKPIEKKMIVQTNIELQPAINYVSASNDCHFLSRLGVDIPGIYGDLSANSIKIREPGSGKTDRIYHVSDKFFESLDICTEKLARAKNDEKEVIQTYEDFVVNIQDDPSLSLEEQNERISIAP